MRHTYALVSVLVRFVVVLIPPPPPSQMCAFYAITERISDEKHAFSLQEAADYGGVWGGGVGWGCFQVRFPTKEGKNWNLASDM